MVVGVVGGRGILGARSGVRNSIHLTSRSAQGRGVERLLTEKECAEGLEVALEPGGVAGGS